MGGTLERPRLSFGQRLASAFGFTPLVTDVLSNYSDISHLQHIDLVDLFYLGNSFRMDRANAMKLAVVAKGRNAIANTVGRLPLFDVKGTIRNPIGARSILAQPDPTRPRSSVITWTVDQLIFHPCTWWHVTHRDAYGFPSGVELVMRDRAVLDRDGNLTAIRDRPADRPVLEQDVIRIDAPNSGLLVDAERVLRRAMVIESAAAKAEDNPVPGFELHNEGDAKTRDEIDELLGNWIEGRRKHGVGYTSKGIKAVAHGAAPENLLIDGRKRVDLELARHLNTPAWAVDVAIEGASLTYNNPWSRRSDLIDLACAPYMAAIADRLSMGDVTPRGWTVAFDTDEYTKPDMKTRFETYQIGKAGTFITDEQIAAWEGWPTPTGVPA